MKLQTPDKFTSSCWSGGRPHIVGLQWWRQNWECSIYQLLSTQLQHLNEWFNVWFPKKKCLKKTNNMFNTITNKICIYSSLKCTEIKHNRCIFMSTVVNETLKRKKNGNISVHRQYTYLTVLSRIIAFFEKHFVKLL